MHKKKQNQRQVRQPKSHRDLCLRIAVHPLKQCLKLGSQIISIGCRPTCKHNARYDSKQTSFQITCRFPKSPWGSKIIIYFRGRLHRLRKRGGELSSAFSGENSGQVAGSGLTEDVDGPPWASSAVFSGKGSAT